MTFAIIGSCVTRDIWGFADRHYEGHGKYFARTSLACFTSPVVPLKQTDLKALPSAFQRASIIADAYRQSLPWVIENKPSKIILDLIDERFDLVDTGRGLLNNSFELHASGVVKTLFPKARLIKKYSDEGISLWTDGIHKLLDDIRAHTPETKVILHRAWFQNRVQVPGGDPVTWERDVALPGRTGTIDEFNGLLTKLYQISADAGLTTVVEASTRNQVAAAQHQWGTNPIHYVDDYYTDCWKQLSPLIS